MSKPTIAGRIYSVTMRQRDILVMMVAVGDSLAGFIPPLMVGPWTPSISSYWCLWTLGMPHEDVVSHHGHRAPSRSPRGQRSLLVLLGVGGKLSGTRMKGRTWASVSRPQAFVQEP